MWKIARIEDESVGGEAVVKERTFEEEMDEGVEEVPNEDNAELGGRGGVKEAYGGEVGGKEKGKSCEKAPNSANIDHKGRMGFHLGYESV